MLDFIKQTSPKNQLILQCDFGCFFLLCYAFYGDLYSGATYHRENTVLFFLFTFFSLSAAVSLACSSGGGGGGVGVQVVDSPLLTQQIEAQRLCIKHLKNENNRLKVQAHERPAPPGGVAKHRRVFAGSPAKNFQLRPLQAEKMRSQLAALPPLHVTKLPCREGGRPEVLSSALYRKTDQLLETLLQMSVNVKVVDVTGKSPGTLTSPRTTNT